MDAITIKADLNLFEHDDNAVLDSVIASIFSHFRKFCDKSAYNIDEQNKKMLLQQFSETFTSVQNIRNFTNNNAEEKHPLEMLTDNAEGCLLLEKMFNLHKMYIKFMQAHGNDVGVVELLIDSTKNISDRNKYYINKYIFGVFPFKIVNYSGTIYENSFICDSLDELRLKTNIIF